MKKFKVDIDGFKNNANFKNFIMKKYGNEF